MASRHSKPSRVAARVSLTVVVGLIAVAVAAVGIVMTVHVTDGGMTAARESTMAPAAQQPLSQEGRIVAVSPTSVTARSVDGFARTYLIDAQTNAITAEGSSIVGAGTPFAVDDEVAIIGVVRDGTAFATAVAERQVTNLAGPPMDAV